MKQLPIIGSVIKYLKSYSYEPEYHYIVVRINDRSESIAILLNTDIAILEFSEYEKINWVIHEY